MTLFLGVEDSKANQLIELETGEVVRYFTEDQLKELYKQLLERDNCLEDIENTELRLSLCMDSLEIQENLLSNTLDILEEYENLDSDFMFCRNSWCTLGIGFGLGVVITGATIGVLNVR